LGIFGDGGGNGATSGDAQGLVLLPIVDAPGVGDGDEVLLLRGGSGDVFSGNLVRLVVSLFCERGMIWISPWCVFSGPPSLVAPALDQWVDGPEEGGGLGVLPSSPAGMLLICPKDRCVREWSVALALATNPSVELLGGKTEFSKLGGAGGRRCPLRKTKKTDCFIIADFLKVFFVIWGCTVLQF